MNAAPQPNEAKLLSALALALVEQPRANLQELARAVGVSKATLYRFCKTREQLVQSVTQHCIRVFNQDIQAIRNLDAPPHEQLRTMLDRVIEYRELAAFMLQYFDRSEDAAGIKAAWNEVLDAYFLRGQQAGIFRIDIPAATMTEMWNALIRGMIDAEQRGRVARAGLPAMLEAAFLDGFRARPPVPPEPRTEAGPHGPRH